MGLLDKLKNMFNKVDETVNAPQPSQSTDSQASVDTGAPTTPASQEPASIGGVSTPPADTPLDSTPAATPEDNTVGQTTPPENNLPQ